MASLSTLQRLDDRRRWRAAGRAQRPGVQRPGPRRGRPRPDREGRGVPPDLADVDEGGQLLGPAPRGRRRRFRLRRGEPARLPATRALRPLPGHEEVR